MYVPPPPELTQRQQQILQLLQSGKVNKEVARELDIGLGTVKQHIVAIFKKLKVRNRTEAVSRNIDLRRGVGPQGMTPLHLPGVQLTTRPCVVLSIALPKDADPTVVQALYDTLASMASAHDAIFLTRHGNAGEVIFGVQLVTEYDVAVALQTASRVYRSLLAAHPSVQGKLRGCLIAGLAFASMRRFGGWTGEVIASAAIAAGRALLQTTRDGLFACDKSVLELSGAFGLLLSHELEHGVRFETLETLPWNGVRPSYPLVGRTAERSSLLAALRRCVAGHGSQLLIEGEMGMGKSRLCQELVDAAHAKNVPVWYFRALPQILGVAMYEIVRNETGSIDKVLAALRATSTDSGSLIIVDDVHLIARESQDALFAATEAASAMGKLVVFAGRTGFAGLAPRDSESLHLRRLPLRDIQALIRSVMDTPATPSRAAMAQDIQQTAAGVPLFAVELAREPDDGHLSLSLLVAVHSRLDKLQLDSSLLHLVAHQSRRISVLEVETALPDDLSALSQQIERAVATGVLSRSSDGALSFTHPMIRRVIDHSVME